MRQRNDTGQALAVHTDPPQLLEPGDELDHDTYVVGLTVLDPPADDAGAADDGDAPTDKPAPTRAARTAKEATNR